MLTFFGTPVLHEPREYSERPNQSKLTHLFGVSDTRFEAIAEQLEQARERATIKQELGTGLDFNKLMLTNEVETESPSELALVGFLLGRLYADESHRARQSQKKSLKMLKKLRKNPEAAMNQMLKQISKPLKDQDKK